MHVLIIGAGLAGLACGRELQRRGHTITLVEASDGVGGRVRSDAVAGYILDRGFQVLFNAYPAVRRQIDLEALQLHAFDPGALVAHEGRLSVLSDPLRDRGSALAAAFTPLVSPLDKLRTLRLTLELRATDSAAIRAEPDSSTLEYLRRRGFGEAIIERFFRPFYGGIFLDRSLSTSARSFRYYFKMLCEGSACLPAGGIGRVSEQLAAPLLQAGLVRLHSTAVTLIHEAGRVVGARLASGEELRADAVVLATSAPAAARLSGMRLPTGALSVSALYFGGAQPLYRGKKIVLHAAPDAFVNNAQMLSNVAPSYAPAGRHLLSVVVLGAPSVDDEELAARAMADLRLMFSGSKRALRALNGYASLGSYRINYAQFPQPPGFAEHLPSNRAGRPGLYFAAEFTEASSIDGALTSGERCAALVAADQ